MEEKTSSYKYFGGLRRSVIHKNRGNIASHTQYRYENIQGSEKASKGIAENEHGAMKNCKYYRELISRYIDNDLVGMEKRLLIGHLFSCGECMEVLYACSLLRKDTWYHEKLQKLQETHQPLYR